MLYHYTDFKAFDGIIRCAELRLNNILNMNDTAEMRLFMHGMCKTVLERFDEEGNNDLHKKIEAYFIDELKKEFNYSAYAACFSEHRDDAAQWERYGNFGQGVCIGFHEELLERMVGGAISLREVYYQEDMREHQLVNQIYEIFRDEKDFDKGLPALKAAMNEAWIQSAAFKHPSFSSEKEVRLVVSPSITNDFLVEPKYHAYVDRIKKYYPLDLNKMCGKLNMHLSDLIGEIIIGPTSPQSLPILEDFIDDCGLNVLKERTHLSSCPLRKPTT